MPTRVFSRFGAGSGAGMGAREASARQKGVKTLKGVPPPVRTSHGSASSEAAKLATSKAAAASEAFKALSRTMMAGS